MTNQIKAKIYGPHSNSALVVFTLEISMQVISKQFTLSVLEMLDQRLMVLFHPESEGDRDQGKYVLIPLLSGSEMYHPIQNTDAN